jgi:hypothetical protein
VINRLLRYAFTGLVIWGAIAWLGTSTVALGIAILAVLGAQICFESSNNHATQLQLLRERMVRLEEAANSSYERVRNELDRITEQNSRISERLDTTKPAWPDDD